MASVQAAAAAAAPSAQEPPAKRQKVIDSTDRLELDVGGTKFVTTATTLKDHSAYFASLLSDNWADSRDRDDGAIFLDRDPVAFGKLLAYMRRGIIKIEEIDVDVLTLAEFLGVEQLLRAIKIRWYINIGKGPVHSDDDDIAAAFDQEHGGILKALSAGLFCYFLSRNEVDPDKDFANLSISLSDARGWGDYKTFVHEVKGGEAGAPIRCGGIIGALNGMYAKGYIWEDDQYDNGWPTYDVHMVKFSRRSHSVMHSTAAAEIFVPPSSELERQRERHYVKQFVLQMKELEDGSLRFIAPAQFSDNLDSYAESTVTDESFLWLEKQKFVTRERGIEDVSVIKEYLKFVSEDDVPVRRICAILSRQMPKGKQEE